MLVITGGFFGENEPVNEPEEINQVIQNENSQTSQEENSNKNNRQKTPENINSAFIHPVEGRISSPFGPRWGSFHEGIDYAIPTGTPVKASRDGMVILSEWVSGYGNTVVIEHDDSIRTLSAHNKTLLVHGGQMVKQGDIIAKSGNSGISTGPHLHFEIQIDGKPVDPQNYLN